MQDDVAHDQHALIGHGGGGQLSAQPRLVERVCGSLDDCTFMCACYPGGGARYVKHRDALPYKAGRKLTVIYYLNAHWRPGDGGELRIWPNDDAPWRHEC